MFDVLREVLQSPEGSFSFILGIMILAGWLIYFITKKVTEITTNHSAFVKRMDKTDERLDRNFDEIRTDISFIKGTLEVINSQSPYTQRKSPISLTPKGENTAKELKADEIINKNWSKIKENIAKGAKENNAYDIQDYCMTIAIGQPEVFLEKEDLDSIKEYAFQHGRPLQMYMQIIGILIRDKYFSENGIDAAEADKHSTPDNA